MLSYFSSVTFDQKRIGYLRWPYRLALSVLVAHLITVEGQSKSSFQLFQQLNYWVALFFSMIAAFALMQLIHWITRWLDSRLPWISRWPIRLVMQFLLGVVLVLVIDIIFIRFYFWALGGDFQRSGYMRIEFPIVKWMVLSMNMLYVAWYFAVSYLVSEREKQALSEQLSDFYQMVEKSEGYVSDIEGKLGSKVVVVPVSDVVCFEREENVGYVWTAGGRRYNIDLKMPELAELLDPRVFYQISRSVMISMEYVQGYERIRNKQGMVILREDLGVEASMVVSRYRFDGFKKLLSLYKDLP